MATRGRSTPPGDRDREPPHAGRTGLDRRRYARQPVVWQTEADFIVDSDRTLAGVVDAYAERAAATERTVRAALGLDAPCIGPEHSGLDLRWVLLHLIDETAHHAGHADSTREMLDDRRSGW